MNFKIHFLRVLCTTAQSSCEAECMLGSIWYTWLRSGYIMILPDNLKSNLTDYVNHYLSLKKSMHKQGEGYDRSRQEFSLKLRGGG